MGVEVHMDDASDFEDWQAYTHPVTNVQPVRYGDEPSKYSSDSGTRLSMTQSIPGISTR